MRSKSTTTVFLVLLMASSLFVVNTVPTMDTVTSQRLERPQSTHTTSTGFNISPPSILVYTEFVDDRPGEEYENTMTAINNTFGIDYLYTNLTDYNNLDAQLPGNDILLIPEQENANTNIMKTVGTTWASTLTTFVDSGGVVVLLDFGNETAPGLGLHIYNASGLMQLGPVLGQYPSAALMEMNRLPSSFGDALGRQVKYRWVPRNNTFAVTTTDGTIAFADYDTHNPVCVHKIMGHGHVVFLGFDLSDPGPYYEQIVGNSIRLPNHVVFDYSQHSDYTWTNEHPDDYYEDDHPAIAFVEDLVEAGFAVSRMDTLDAAFLNASDVLVCPLPEQYIHDYDAGEIAILDAYVANGGSIFIQSDCTTFGDNIRALANNFGYDWSRDTLIDTDDTMRYWVESQIAYEGDNILSHPITYNVSRVEFYASDAFTTLPANAERIIVTDWDITTCWGEGGWFDNWLGADGLTLMAVSVYGAGKVSVVLDGNFMDFESRDYTRDIVDTDIDGEIDYYDSDNDVLLLNTIHWLANNIPENDAPLLSGLTHIPASPANGEQVTVYVTATDSDGLANITCHYRDNLGVWQNVSMTPEGGDQYSAIIGNFNVSEEKDYYIRAFDSSTDMIESVSEVVHLNGINYFPETPMLYNPGTTDNDGVFLLNWTSSIDADGSIDHYEIQVSNHSQFATTLDIITAYTDDYLMTVSENDTYYFRVRAVDDDGTVGFWCFQQSINVVIIQGPIVSTPVLSPSEPKHGDSVTLSVDVTDQDGVKNITCYYSVNSGPWQNVSMIHETGDTYSCALGTYFIDDIVDYYLKAFDNSTSHHPTTTSIYSFEILNQPPTEPTLYDPGTTITVSNLLVNWTVGYDLEGAIDHYELQMSSSDDFSVIIDSWSVPTTDYVVTGLSDGTYYFRVKTVDDRGAVSPWSNTENITVDMSGPSISSPIHSPSNPLHGDTVIVSVNITDPSGIDNATCVYRINSGFWQSVIMTHGTGDTYSCNLGSYIVDDVVEYYILTFDNTTMHNWANTTVQMFEIFNQPPTDPTLANPGTVTYASYVYVTWTPSTDLEGSIDHYHIQISRFDDFSVILNEWNETTTNFNITDLTSGIYYIRVRAFDFHNASSQWSNVESIEVILTTTTPTPPPTTTPTPTPTSPTSPTTGSPFDPDILNLVFLITTIGSLVIIIIVVVGIIRQRSRSQRKYQF